jgi:hypothetical protein
MSRIPCLSRATWLRGWIACMLLMLTPVSQAQQGYGKPEDPVAAEVLGMEIRTSNPGEMAYVIKQTLTVNYAKTHDLQATNAEIEQFIAGKQKADARVRKEVEARRVEIQQALQSDTLPDTDREQLEGELQFLQQMQLAEQDVDKQNGGSERAAAETQMARAIIGQWKVNKALYKQYGGRVIYQQGGPEPLDAYYKFFKAAQKDGELKFVNKDLEAALWSYFSSDSKHKFYPENEKDQAINTPWWQMEPPPGK